MASVIRREMRQGAFAAGPTLHPSSTQESTTHQASSPAHPTPSPVQSGLTLLDELQHAREVLARSREAVMRLLRDVRLGRSISLAEVHPVLEDISSSVARHPSALISCAKLKSRDEYTYMHSVAVAALMLNLARRLGLDEQEVHDAGMAGLLHDIGKMAVPEAILNKPGKLSDEEFALVRTHSERGHSMLLAAGDMPEIALDVCLHHHERVDGTGYPHGLRGSEISIHARMGAICDVYDAVTSARVYKDAWQPADSLARMYSWKGHFDEAVLEAFIKSLGIYPIGSLVRLSSGQLAVVVDQREEDAMRPLVRSFYSAVACRPTMPSTIDLAASARGEVIVRRENPANWGFADWDNKWQKLLT